MIFLTRKMRHNFQIRARNTVVQRFGPHGNVKGSLLHTDLIISQGHC